MNTISDFLFSLSVTQFALVWVTLLLLIGTLLIGAIFRASAKDMMNAFFAIPCVLLLVWAGLALAFGLN